MVKGIWTSTSTGWQDITTLHYECNNLFCMTSKEKIKKIVNNSQWDNQIIQWIISGVPRNNQIPKFNINLPKTFITEKREEKRRNKIFETYVSWLRLISFPYPNLNNSQKSEAEFLH